MHPADEPASSPVEVLLENAEVLTDTYDDYDTEAARARVTARCATEQQQVCPTGAGAPPRHRPSAHEQAAQDLNLAVALILNAPEAAASLTRLVDHDQIDPEGAVVFAALLHLTGHRDAAQFWWQFAAGGGSRTAAFCLFLAHQQRAEFRDAAYWRGQSRGLPRPGRRPTAPPTLSSLLPETVGHDLLSQCHRGRHPTLPAPLEAVINRLRVDSADEDFGEVPQPDVSLTHDLTRGPARGTARRAHGRPPGTG
ncbi:hypothetical protein [Streptomyces sp. NBC_00872]|uniref:hypothetical protein n=1 Tax=Streptomyces sp. NBC_00872 TaxID=2903686 RepID=UPI0038687EB2|nr:hypothetical protein OG214_35825 [Streptomyces sp. NBC_00872]